MEDPIWPKTPEKRNIGNFLQFQSNVISKWLELPKLYLFLIKLMVQAYIIFKIAILHSHVAKKNGGFNMAEKRKASIVLHFQTQTISKWEGAAKILSFLGKNRAAGLHDFQNDTAVQPCCNEKWRTHYG